MRNPMLAVALLVSMQAWAQYGLAPEQTGAKNQRPTVLQQVGIDQKIGAQVPLDLHFRDEQGRDVTLGSYFDKRPVILALVYYDCPMLCSEVLQGAVGALRALQFSAGKDFDFVAVSFDPRETPEIAAEKRKVYVGRYHRDGGEQGFHFLTGKDAEIKALTEKVGFRYVWDDHSKQFAHGSGLILVTPEGKVAQYYYGIEYSPNDMRLGIIEASKGKLGNVVDAVLLYCYHYDPVTGKYGARIVNAMRIGAAMTMLLLGTFIVVSLRAERRKPAA
jgi:protein SCO1/2